MATIKRGARGLPRERGRRGYRAGSRRRRAVLMLIAAGAVGIVTTAGVPAAFAGAGGTSVNVSQAEIGVGLGTPRSLPSGYYGVNYDYGGEIASSDDTGFAAQIAALSPGVVRWPAGTGANYFVWNAANRRGAPTTHTTQPGCQASANISGFYFTLSDLVAEYRATRVPPVFDLDVTKCAATSSQTSFDNQLSFLKQASAAGVPVDYIELGNEFYLCDADYVTDFPTAAAYADTASQWIKSLHESANFPDAKVAVVASNESGPATGSACHTRTYTWNDQLVKELLKDAGGNKSLLPSAYTVHSHPRFATPLTLSNLPQFFDLAHTSVNGVSAAVANSLAASLSGVQSPQEWLTEIGFSLNSDGNEKTFADALANSVQALLLATAMPDTTQAEFWSSFGPEVPYAYLAEPSSPNQQTTVTLTPDGRVMTWVDQAAQGATAMTPITFSGGPVLSGTSDSALVGASFTKGTPATQILVNLSGQTQTVKVGTVVPAGRPYQQMSATDPTGPIKLSSPPKTTNGTTSAATGLKLASYSITIIN
jgi:hypothetical protein